MPDTDERLDRIEQRLDSVDDSVGEGRRELAGLREEVAGLRGLPEEVRNLRQQVQRLDVLGEARDEKIRLIAEVQSHHGMQLERITKDLEPLREIRDFIRTVADDHERRITALEKHTNQ